MLHIIFVLEKMVTARPVRFMIIFYFLLILPAPKFNPDSFMRHDQLGYIGPDRAYAAGINLPVPVGMFMPQIPQPFHTQPMPGE